MRFTVRPGEDPIARVDSTLLAAMGLPGGGIVSVGSSHVAVRPGEVPQPTAIMIGPIAMRNAGVAEGDNVDVKRALLPQARRVVLEGKSLPVAGQQIAHSLQGTPLAAGDTVVIDPSYTDTPRAEPTEIKVVSVEPDGAVLV
ncbi:MAG: hypothetical protein OEM22_03240, partial [Acidimicrobiia bacterium]|nr:hypothetical protein [Acidimicrobiia bacterium]